MPSLRLPLALLCTLLTATASFAAGEEQLESALLLGPLPAPPAYAASPRVAGAFSPTPEIDPGAGLPRDGARVTLTPGQPLVWRRVEAERQGFPLDAPGVYWLAARLVGDRGDEVTLTADGGCAIFAEGEPLAALAPVAPNPVVSGRAPAGRTERFVFVRVVAGPDGGLVSVTATGEHGVHWDLEPWLTLSDLDRARDVVAIQDLTVSPGGTWVVRRLSRRNRTGEGRREEVALLDAGGHVVAGDLGGPNARPIAFAPDGATLLLRRPGESGTDLLEWTMPHGPLRTVLTDEPGLGAVKYSPDGKHLVLASTRGLAPAAATGTAARRWDVLRERISDWNPLPHLHLVEVATGTRTALTRPGDSTLDDVAWLPDGRALVYGRTMPQAARPWFHTELRRLDLAAGADTLLTTFTGGWEVRPKSFAPHPDGRRMSFLGPPHQVGGENPEHNVYNQKVWMLDLATGEFARVTHGTRYCFAGGRGLPAWTSDGRTLLLPANAGGRDVLTALRPHDDGWEVREVETAAGSGDGWAMDPDAKAVAYTTSSPTLPPALHLVGEVGADRVLEDPNADLVRRWRLSEARDASFTGPGGEEIEAWWYRPPSVAWESLGAGTVPLLVYYYGGSSPTIKSFSSTHQFWAANGYAVLVLNPRGASGYGDAFADHHAGDGGPSSGADILAGTRALLAREPRLDAAGVGCYGGSYGGFMTMYLVSHSDLFAAACSMYGIADQATYWGQGTWGWTYGDMANAGAVPWRDAGFLERASPLFQADRIETPLLLLHGEADRNVTPGQSVEMFTALQTLGRTVELVTFPGEDHGIGGTWANYVGHRTMMLEWFDRWLRDRPAAWERRWK